MQTQKAIKLSGDEKKEDRIRIPLYFFIACLDEYDIKVKLLGNTVRLSKGNDVLSIGSTITPDSDIIISKNTLNIMKNTFPAEMPNVMLDIEYFQEQRKKEKLFNYLWSLKENQTIAVSSDGLKKLLKEFNIETTITDNGKLMFEGDNNGISIIFPVQNNKIIIARDNIDTLRSCFTSELGSVDIDLSFDDLLNRRLQLEINKLHKEANEVKQDINTGFEEFEKMARKEIAKNNNKSCKDEARRDSERYM